MRKITTLNGSPQSFINWIKKNSDEIDKKINDENVSGDNLWAYFKENQLIYKELKETLVQDQGFICCYCGQRIKNDHDTVIEHLQPKSIYKNLVFTFDNLLASCKGGSKNIIHPVDKDETLTDIALRFGVDIEHLEEVYVNVNEEELFRKRYDIENLSLGDRLVIFPQLVGSEQHCDTKKKNDEIEITPKQDNCQNKFAYDLQNGKISITEGNISTIEVLGLNSNKYINRLRKKTIDESFNLKQRLILDFGHSKAEFESNRLKIVQNLDKISLPSTTLPPFVFVTIWSLNN